jgi:hypothetical protein
MVMIAMTEAIISLALIAFVLLPNADRWLVLLAAVLLHVSYEAFRFESYQHGDLSHVYLIARGAAPLTVALLSVTIMGETLSCES